jgi:hypothetical protein
MSISRQGSAAVNGRDLDEGRFAPDLAVRVATIGR